MINQEKIILNCDERLIPFLKDHYLTKLHIKVNEILWMKPTLICIYQWDHYRYFSDLLSFNKSSKGYLKADKTKISEFKKKLSNKKNIKIIGLSWFTNSQVQMASFRNVQLTSLVSEINNSETKFINLQYGDTSKEITELKKEFGIDIYDLKEVDKKDDIDIGALI